MWIKSLLDLRPTKKRGRRLPLHRQRTARLYLEQLEDRTLPSIAFVGSLGGTIAEGTATHPKSTATINVTGTPVVGGDIIVEFALHANNSSRQTGPVTVTDNAGNTYTEVVDTLGPPGGSADIRTVILVAQDITAVPGTITVNFPSTDLAAVSAAEFTGLAAIDQTNFAVGQSTSPSSGPVTTSAANELVIGSIGIYSATPTSFTPGSGYTALTEETAVNSNGTLQIGEAPEYQIVSSAGQYEATGTLNPSARWADAIVTFEAAMSSPTLTTTPNETTVTLGASPVTLTDTADLEAGSSPTGTITFTLYQGATLVDTETATVNGNGMYTTPTGYTLPTTGTVTGTYQWDASYSGDASNNPVSDDNAADEQVVISPSSPPPTGTLALTTTPNETAVTLSASPVTLTDTATLAGAYNPTGTITFTLFYNGGATPVDTETVTVSGDGAYTTPTGFTLPTTGTVTGTYQWDASYSGDTNNGAITDNDATDEQTVVSPASPPPTGTLALTTAPNETTVTLSSATPPVLTDTATLAGAYFPTGTITFTLFYNGGATPVDTETVTVSGDGAYTTPTGFTLPTTGTVTGTYQWDASYSGDTNNGAITDNDATDEQTVVSPASPPPTGTLALTTAPNETTVTLSSATPPVLTDTATLAGAYRPTGTITFTLFYNGGATPVDTETVTVSGDGAYTTPTGYTLPTTGTVAGTYQWDASYSGDGNNGAITDDNATDEQVAVSPANSTGTPPLTITTTAGGTVTVGSGSTLTDSATLSGTYHGTGTVTFYLFAPGVTPNGTDSNNVYSDAVTVNGDGAYSTASGSNPGGYLPTMAGTYQWVAVYGGDGNNDVVTSLFNSEPVTVNPASSGGNGGSGQTSPNPFPLGANTPGVGAPLVNLLQNGQLVANQNPFPGFTGQLRVASGELPNGDTFYVYGAGPASAGGPAVKVVDETTGATLAEFFAFAPSFTGGVFVAVGDVNGDGVPDIIVGAGAGGGPEVKVIDGTKLNQVNAQGEIENTALLADFFAYAPTFTGGVSVAAADFNGDGKADVVTGAGPGGGPEVKVIDATKLNQVNAQGEIMDSTLLADFFAYAPNFTGGVFVAAGDINGVPDLITGAGAGGGPEVKVIDGTKLKDTVTSGSQMNEIMDAALLGDFFAYAPNFTGGVRVGTVEINGQTDVITGAGPSGGPEVKVVDSTQFNRVVTSGPQTGEIMDGALLDDFFATTGSDPNGVFV